MKTLKTALLPLPFVIVALISACAIIPEPLPPVQAYDLGTLPTRTGFSHLQFPQNVVLGRITATPWLQSDRIYYRFSYVNRTQLNQYTQNRWLAPPASLLSEQLLKALSNRRGETATSASARLNLNLKLLRFEQIFTGPKQSHALVEIHASLVRVDNGMILKQRVFRFDQSKAAPDAAGAVSALSAETNRFIRTLVRWLRIVGDKRHSS